VTRSTGERHEWNERLCDQLQKIAWGRHATSLLASPIPRRNQAIVTLPTWTWAEPKANMGRKARAADGGLLLLPLQVSWDVDSLFLASASETVTASWSAVGAGYTLTGTTSISTAPLPEPVEIDGSLVPTTIVAATLSRPRFASRLHEIAAEGRNAYWEALTDLEGHLRWAFQRAHSAVAAELYPGQQRPVLDETSQEILQTKLLMGDEGDTNCVVSRLIDRCLAPGRFERVDPEKYVLTALVSASETAIRRRIADPHIGRKIRRFASSNPEATTVDDVVASYALAYPNDHLSQKRAASALTAGHRVPHLVSLSDQTERHLVDSEATR